MVEINWLSKVADSEEEVETSFVEEAREAPPAREISVPFERKDANIDALLWSDELYSVPSTTGLRISQATSLTSAAVYACVKMLADDVSKLRPFLFKRNEDGSRSEITSGPVATLLRRPNSWQTWFECCNQMMVGLVLRGNAYAVIINSMRGEPLLLVPINPDKVALWEGPDGQLYYMVTRTGLHQNYILRDEPLLVPFDNMLHIKEMSSNGLIGVSSITLGRESIGLSLAQEQLAAKWVGNGAKPSGVLSTDKKLTPEALERLKATWVSAHSGLQNSGKVAVLENGLTWSAMSMTMQDMEFIASRSFQLQEIARKFRVPLHMLADASFKQASTATVAQAAQEYANYTLSTYTEMWAQRLVFTFGLDYSGIEIGFDMGVLLRADLGSRMKIYQTAVMGGIWSPNECRIDDGKAPKTGKETGPDALLAPSNSTPYGSDHSGDGPAGNGAPKKGDETPKGN